MPKNLAQHFREDADKVNVENRATVKEKRSKERAELWRSAQPILTVLKKAAEQAKNEGKYEIKLDPLRFGLGDRPLPLIHAACNFLREEGLEIRVNEQTNIPHIDPPVNDFDEEEWLRYREEVDKKTVRYIESITISW